MPRDSEIVKTPAAVFPTSSTFAFVGNVNRLESNAHNLAERDIISATVFYCVKLMGETKKNAK